MQTEKRARADSGSLHIGYFYLEGILHQLFSFCKPAAALSKELE